MKNSTYAAIDIGSYNCRLTIFKRKNGFFKIIHNYSHSTNLIKNLSYNNEFTDENISKTLGCLTNFSKKLKRNRDTGWGQRSPVTQAIRRSFICDLGVEAVFLYSNIFG